MSTRKYSAKDLARIEGLLDQEEAFLLGRFRQKTNATALSRFDAEQSASAAFGAYVLDMDSLIMCRSDLRAAKDAFNIEKGIKERTASIARLNRILDVHKEVLELHRVHERSAFNNNAPVKYNVGLHDALEDSARAEVRKIERQIQRLKDSCAGINSQQVIEMPEAFTDFLVEKGLLDA